MKCIFCNHKKLYHLQTEQLKCASCKKKFSTQKIDLENKIFDCFQKDLSAKECSELLKINYITANNHYMKIRQKLSLELEEQFNLYTPISFDEYLYIEKSKRTKKELHKAKNIITFEYGNKKVYNLLMPDLQRYEDTDAIHLKRFLSLSKLESKTTKSTITQFWDFFEKSILKYKGVSDEYFFYYLKEIEWKFNNV